MKTLFQCKVPTRLILVISIVAFNVSGWCATRQADEDSTGTRVAQAINQFTFDLFAEVAAETQGNVLLSPLSVYAALSMAAAGAKGETLSEFEHVLHAEPFTEEYARSVCDLITAGITTSGNDTSVQLEIASAIWPDQSIHLRQCYLNLVDHCQMPVQQVNFGSDPETACRQINQWVEDNTHGHIPGLLKKEDIHPEIVTVLINALWFRGDWTAQFEVRNTKKGSFQTLAGDTLPNVPMMRMDECPPVIKYAENENLSMLALPYGDGEFIMLIVLPESSPIPIDPASVISLTKLQEMLPRLRSSSNELLIMIPRYKIQERYNLEAQLIAAGLQKAFTPKADFTAMFERNGIWIEKVIHGTDITVNEAGTEFSAATAIDLAQSAPEVFIADHPFLFAIVHNPTGVIIGIGRVCEPEQEM